MPSRIHSAINFTKTLMFLDILKEFRIREIPNLSTDANSNTNIFVSAGDQKEIFPPPHAAVVVVASQGAFEQKKKEKKKQKKYVFITVFIQKKNFCINKTIFCSK